MPGTVTFTTSDTSRTFAITAENDDVESATLGFGTMPSGYVAGGTTTTTVDLADNEMPSE